MKMDRVWDWAQVIFLALVLPIGGLIGTVEMWEKT